ncbi:hypothetical protein ACQP3L_32080, partial [Escherichia coli]
MLNITPLTQTFRLRINKCELLILRSFCKGKDRFNQTLGQPTEWGKIFTNPVTDGGLISKIHKEVKKLDTKLPNNPIKKWG